MFVDGLISNALSSGVGNGLIVSALCGKVNKPKKCMYLTIIGRVHLAYDIDNRCVFKDEENLFRGVKIGLVILDMTGKVVYNGKQGENDKYKIYFNKPFGKYTVVVTKALGFVALDGIKNVFEIDVSEENQEIVVWLERQHILIKEIIKPVNVPYILKSYVNQKYPQIEKVNIQGEEHSYVIYDYDNTTPLTETPIKSPETMRPVEWGSELLNRLSCDTSKFTNISLVGTAKDFSFNISIERGFMRFEPPREGGAIPIETEPWNEDDHRKNPLGTTTAIPLDSPFADIPSSGGLVNQGYGQIKLESDSLGNISKSMSLINNNIFASISGKSLLFGSTRKYVLYNNIGSGFSIEGSPGTFFTLCASYFNSLFNRSYEFKYRNYVNFKNYDVNNHENREWIAIGNNRLLVTADGLTYPNKYNTTADPNYFFYDTSVVTLSDLQDEINRFNELYSNVKIHEYIEDLPSKINFEKLKNSQFGASVYRCARNTYMGRDEFRNSPYSVFYKKGDILFNTSVMPLEESLNKNGEKEITWITTIGPYYTFSPDYDKY